VQIAAPGVFPVIVNDKVYPAAVFVDGKYVGDPSIGPQFRNAKPGEVIQMFATGLLASAAGVQVDIQTITGVSVTLGTITVSTDAAALVGPGEFQINFTVPQEFENLPEGAYPVSIRSKGVPSSTVNAHIPGYAAGCPSTCMVIPIEH
jgi:uncharacterized protein (TIGR03437 family)